MKIEINTKPYEKILIYEGCIKKDISKNDDEYIEGIYCFDLYSSNFNEDQVVWLEDKPDVKNIKELENQILKQFKEKI
jgi:hypothetical protein